jgi:jasmonate O-methyltransferase
MKVERDLHMSRGDGETSYASNSRLQVCVLLHHQHLYDLL